MSSFLDVGRKRGDCARFTGVLSVPDSSSEEDAGLPFEAAGKLRRPSSGILCTLAAFVIDSDEAYAVVAHKFSATTEAGQFWEPG